MPGAEPEGEADGSPPSDAAPEAGRNKKSAVQAGLLVLGTTLSTLSSLIVTLIIVRLLGKAEVGTLLALMLIYDTVALVVTAGFPQTLMYFLPARALAERRAVAKKIASTMAVLGALACVVLVAIALLGSRALAAVGSSEQNVQLLPLLVFAPLAIVDIPARLLSNLLVAEGKARVVTLVGVLRSIGTSVAVLVPVAMGAGVWTVAICYVAVGLVHGLVLPATIHFLYRDAPIVPSPVTLKELFAFSIPLGTTDVISLLNTYFDRYLILFAFPAAGFATYQAGAWQIPVITFVPYAVGAAFQPTMVALFKKQRPAEALKVWQDSIAKVSLIVVPVTMAFMLGAEELMTLLFTDAYAEAAPVFRCYASLGLLRVAAYGAVIVSAGRPRYVLQAAVLSMISNIVLSVVLLSTVGFVGPALGTAIAFVPTVMFYCWCIGRATNVPFARVFPLQRYFAVFGLSALAVGPALAFKLWVPLAAGWSFAGQVAIVLVGFSILGTLLSVIQREDWEYLLNWLRLKILK